MTRPRLSLLWGTQAPTRTLLTAATALVAGGTPVRLFDGGNAFDGYFVARLARRLARLTSLEPGEPADLDSSSTVSADPASHRNTSRPDQSVLPGLPGMSAGPAASGRDGPHEALNRLRLSRAFTCFQLAQLIENAPAGPEPLFVLDVLATFYDESVPLRDSERLLGTTLTHLKRLAAAAPVIVGAHEPQTLVKDRWLLLDHLQTAADTAWMLRAPDPAPVLQPRLL